MQTVIETAAYLRAAEAAGLSFAERTDIVTVIANNPEMGTVIAGTGGCRKVRVAGRSKGKAGGYRLVTFYSGAGIPVFLLTIFGKGEKDNLTKSERNDLAKLSRTLTEGLSAKVTPMRKRT